MRCHNCESYIHELVKHSFCRGCRSKLTSCMSCVVGPYCSSCQEKNGESHKKVYDNGFTYYFQLKEIASILNIPLNSRQSYNLTDAEWSSFFPNQVRNKWEQLKSSKLSPETQQSELFTENRQLTTTLNLKERELKDLQAEIRALETKLNEKEDNSPYQVKINKLEIKLKLVKRKLKEWNSLLNNHD